MWLSTSVPRTRRDAPKRNRCHAAIHDRSPHTQGWVGLVKFGELIVVPFPALRRLSRLARCRCWPRPRGGSLALVEGFCGQGLARVEPLTRLSVAPYGARCAPVTMVETRTTQKVVSG